VFVVAIALVFGGFYLWQGVQTFFLTGGRGVIEATQRAVVVASATAERVTRFEAGRADVTPRPSNTPVPDCQAFVVNVPNAIVREAPAPGAPIVSSLNEGEEVCVLERAGDGEWYAIDRTPGTRRLDLAYMHETVIRALNPTPTPTITPSPLPTVTPLPSDTPTDTPVPPPTRPSPTPDTPPTETPTATSPPPTATPLRQTA
jgi:hypothetical protein